MCSPSGPQYTRFTWSWNASWMRKAVSNSSNRSRVWPSALRCMIWCVLRAPFRVSDTPMYCLAARLAAALIRLAARVSSGMDGLLA